MNISFFRKINDVLIMADIGNKSSITLYLKETINWMKHGNIAIITDNRQAFNWIADNDK